MHVTDRSKTVVMLIDWDNLQICHSRDAPGTELDLQALIALAQSYGTLVSARAYAEWNLLSERLAVYKAGIEPVFAPVMRPEGSPREGKSLADTVMVADGVDLLWTVAPDVFVLATSDKDMIPLARIAKQRGAAVVVLGSDLTAIPLVEMSNVFITYRQLLRELDRVTELEAPVGRAPARERRLRESRRPSSEPYGGGLGSGTGFGGAQIGTGGRGGPRPVARSAQLAHRPPRRCRCRRRVRLGAATRSRLRCRWLPSRRSARRWWRRQHRRRQHPLPSSPMSRWVSALATRRLGAGGGAAAVAVAAGSAALALAISRVRRYTTPSTIETTLTQRTASRRRPVPPRAPARTTSTTPSCSSWLRAIGSRRRPLMRQATTGSRSRPDWQQPPAPSTPLAETAPPPPRRRAVRTSFSSFGPPEISFRPATSTPA